MRPRDHRLDPGDQRLQQLAPDFRVLPPGAGGHMKGMVGILESFHGGARAESFGERLEQLQVCEPVARPLNEQHRDFHLEKVLAARVGWAPGRMQRKAEEREAPDAGKRGCGLRLRGHPAAERFASGNERQRRYKPGGFGDGRAHRSMTKFGRIRPPGALLHIGKLIAQSCDAARAELGRNGGDE